MLCNKPVTMYRLENGEYTHNKQNNGIHTELKRPCGMCIACRLTNIESWTTRMVHESMMHEDTTFITLTYKDDPFDLQPEDLKKFFYKIRKLIYPQRVSYYAVGEYGDDFGRPHYHVILYGLHFSDAIYLKKSPSGRRLYSSDILQKCWTHGHANFAIADVSSMKYCAGYALKKMKGDQYGGKNKDDYYGHRTPEFMRSSRKPALGLRWLEKYYKQFEADDFCIIDGRPTKIPQYYEKKMLDMCPGLLETLKVNREHSSFEHHLAAPLERSEERLDVKHELLTRLFKDYSRNLGD